MLTGTGMDTPVISFILQLYLAVIQKMVAFSLAFVNNAVIEIIQNILGINLYDENCNKMTNYKAVAEERRSSWVSYSRVLCSMLFAISLLRTFVSFHFLDLGQNDPLPRA